MSFKERAVAAGAFGAVELPKDLRYYVSPEKVGLGWHWSEPNQKPVLVGLYSESPPGQLRKGIRHILRLLRDVFRDLGHTQVLAALDYRHPCFTRLLKSYQKHMGFEVAGEVGNSVVLICDVDMMGRF